MRFYSILSFLLFIFIAQNVICQNESNIWYFGDKAGVDFNNNSTQVLNNSKMTAWDGCASICDQNGDLLFYTNGIQIWNKNHEIMENGEGLMGGLSSSQSAIIVPNPNIHHIFYVFTVDQTEDEIASGLRYSEVDINLDNELGAVNENKNILLHTPAYEKLTSVIHENGADKWVVVHDHESNEIYSFLVDGSGVSAQAVISTGGPEIDHLRENGGYIKSSLDGNFLAISSLELGHVLIYSFDNLTGKINEQAIFDKTFDTQISGIEFSPSGKLFYLTEYKIGGRIYQYDMYANNITESKTLIGTASNDYDPQIINPASLQLAPNRKIYQAMTFAKFLNVIKYPDIKGMDCQYVHEATDLGENFSHLGLPQLIYLNITTDFAFENTCVEKPTKFILLASPNYDAVYWDFGDPTSANNNSTEEYPTHIYQQAGTYTTQLTVYYNTQTDIVTHEVIIDDILFSLSEDTTLCDGETLLLNTGIDSNNVTFQWQDASNNETFTVEEEGSYWVILNKNYCTHSDTTIVKYKSPPPEFTLGNDSSLCEGTSIDLIGPNVDAIYQWQDGSSGFKHTASETGVYKLLLDNMCGSSSDEIIFEFKDCSCIPQIPNAFSPNGDGINDIFYAHGECVIQQFNLKILDRFGLIVYETDDPNEGWNGNYNNVLSPQQLFIYQMTYKLINTLPSQTIRGTITLIK